MFEDTSPDGRTVVVITPPEEYGAQLAYNIRARTTMGVFTQLIAQASSHILIASPFVQTYHGFSESPIKAALMFALDRTVHIDMISTGAGIQIFKNGWPDLVRRDNIRFFQPKPNMEDEKYLGSHAKCLVSDGQAAYVGSANFTQPGLAGNLELGLLIDGCAAAQIKSFWQYLMDINFIIECDLGGLDTDL